MTTSNASSISIFVIATNAYIEYALNLIRSSSKWAAGEIQIQFLLLTDSEVDVQQIGLTGKAVTVSTFRIPSYGWPEATLLRFHLMVDHWEHVTGEIVMYLDADTEIVSPLIFADLFDLCTKSASNGVTPVMHPGYFNRSKLHHAINRTRLGPWENRRRSTAYVPYSSRKTYVCGGVIWGLRKSFFQMCVTLKARIESDLQHKVVAKHNDESHLNNWFTNNLTIAATPEWAYASGYSNLNGLMPRIEVIHKPSTFNRTPTQLD